MGPSAERLKSAKKDIVDALTAIERGEHTGVSPTGRSLVDELWQLEESAWVPLLAGLEADEELHGALTRLRKEFSKVLELRDRVFSPIRQVGCRAFFDLSGVGLVVELHFAKGEGESLEIRQDLEDTLRVGALVIESVATVMRKLDVLSIDTKRQCIGQDFEENLKRAAKGVEEIEGLLSSVCDP